MAFSNSHVGKRGGDRVHGAPELSKGELSAGGGIDEGDIAVVGAGRDESGDV